MTYLDKQQFKLHASLLPQAIIAAASLPACGPHAK